jgi:hypothetical protein
MTAPTFRQWEGNRSMTAATKLTLQDRKHTHTGCTQLRFEQVFMTVATIQPFSMRFMWKQHEWLIARVFE